MTDNPLDSRDERVDKLLENVERGLLSLTDFLMKNAQLRIFTKTADGYSEALAPLGKMLPIDLAVREDQVEALNNSEEWQNLRGQSGDSQMVNIVSFLQDLPSGAAPVIPVYRIDVPKEKIADFDGIYSATLTYSEELLATGITTQKFVFNILRGSMPGYTISFTCRKSDSPYRLIECFASAVGASVKIFFNEGIIDSRVGEDELNLEFTSKLLANLLKIIADGTFARVHDLYDLRHQNDRED